jgi:two-component system, LytTR family, sensor kinase
MLLMSDKKTLYWLSQGAGWLFYILVIVFVNLLGKNLDAGIFKVLVVTFITGVFLSHQLRNLILKLQWLKISILQAIPRLLIASILFGVIFSLIYALVNDFLFSDTKKIFIYPFSDFLQLIIAYSPLFLFWSIIYFAFQYLKNYEKEEVKNLRLNASMNEVELSNLRSQLNPHFMFNALNSIRALIDEDPSKAKNAVTQLSSILRSSLISSKKKTLPLLDELKIVKNYLDLESIRYEERLSVKYNIELEANTVEIPPLLLQTLVENAIKHSISKLTNGGEVVITAKINESMLLIEVANTGNLDKDKTVETGIGIANTIKRLQLIYGDTAKFDIRNKDHYVVCTIEIPKTYSEQ